MIQQVKAITQQATGRRTNETGWDIIQSMKLYLYSSFQARNATQSIPQDKKTSISNGRTLIEISKIKDHSHTRSYEATHPDTRINTTTHTHTHTHTFMKKHGIKDTVRKGH